jgi:hypothetical protein
MPAAKKAATTPAVPKEFKVRMVIAVTKNGYVSVAGWSNPGDTRPQETVIQDFQDTALDWLGEGPEDSEVRYYPVEMTVPMPKFDRAQKKFVNVWDLEDVIVKENGGF